MAGALWLESIRRFASVQLIDWWAPIIVVCPWSRFLWFGTASAPHTKTPTHKTIMELRNNASWFDVLSFCGWVLIWLRFLLCSPIPAGEHLVVCLYLLMQGQGSLVDNNTCVMPSEKRNWVAKTQQQSYNWTKTQQRFKVSVIWYIRIHTQIREPNGFAIYATVSNTFNNNVNELLWQCTLDFVPIALINYFDVLGPIITVLVNLSLAEGCLLASFAHAIVSLLIWNAFSSSDLSNYCPSLSSISWLKSWNQ